MTEREVERTTSHVRRRVRWGRVRMPITAASALVLLASVFVSAVPYWLGLSAFAVGFAFYLRLGAPPGREPVVVSSPVTGRWRALNSPADRVPSHGLHAYGQTFAIDVVHEPGPSAHRSTRWWPLARRPGSFPSFGEVVRAPADGRVVKVHQRARDHWSRTSWPALVYLLVVEASFRELTGPNRILGNHVVIDLGDGVYAVLAHLQRNSVLVAPGESVRRDMPIARCGNSGNSSEPHLHFQLMDHRSVLFADGVPFAFDEFTGGGRETNGVPDKSASFVVG